MAPRVGFEPTTLRLTDFWGKIHVLSLVSLTAQGGLPSLPQLSVNVRNPRSGRGGTASLLGTMLAWRATTATTHSPARDATDFLAQSQKMINILLSDQINTCVNLPGELNSQGSLPQHQD